MDGDTLNAFRLAWAELVHVGLPHGKAGLAVKAMLERARNGGARIPELDKPKKPKRMSRAAQWADACSRALDALDNAEGAVTELVELRSEYESWKDNLPENLQNSPVGEKLEAVCDLDLDSVLSSVQEAHSTVEEAEATDLPLGYGKD